MEGYRQGYRYIEVLEAIIDWRWQVATALLDVTPSKLLP
jgi:hypothetical protein